MSRLIPFLLIVAGLFAASARSVQAGSVERAADGGTVIGIRIHDWILPNQTRTDAASRASMAAVQSFVEQFPKFFAEKYAEKYAADPERYGDFDWSRVRLDARPFSGIQVQGVESDLLAIAGGVAPDVLYLNFRRSDTYIREGFLYPLDLPGDAYISAWDQDEWAYRVNPKIRPVIERLGPTGEKRIWAVPYGGSMGGVLLYRRDRFDEAGLSYPDEHWTWDDLYAACRKLCDPAKGRYGIRFARGGHEAWYWTPYLWSAGGEVMSPVGEGEDWQIDFDSPEGAVALEFYTRLIAEPWVDDNGVRRKGYAYRESGDAYHKWSRGDIAMAQGYIDEKMFADLNPDITGMAPMPMGPTGIRGNELNSRMMALFSGIEHPAVRDAAWEFINYFDSREALAIKTRIMVEAGYGHFIHPRYLEMFGYGELIRLAPRGWKRTFELAMEAGRPEPYGKHSNIIYDILRQPLLEAEQLAVHGKLPEDRQERLDVMRGLLARAAQKARGEMLGEVSPRDQRLRRWAAGGFLAVVLIVFPLVIRRVLKDFRPDTNSGRRERGSRRAHFRRYAWAYLLLTPALGTIFFWQYVPLFKGSVIAFQDYRIMGEARWVWLDNFGAVLVDPDWWTALWNAIRYTTLVITLNFLPPVILAILLQETPAGSVLFRTIYYLPAVISGLVAVLLWRMFYDESEYGLLNGVLMKVPVILFLLIGFGLGWGALVFARRLRFHGSRLPSLLFAAAGLLLAWTGLRLAWPALANPEGPALALRVFSTLPEPFRWLSNPETAMFACVLPMVWAGMGPGCLIYLAALKGVPDDMYEAADIDGASFVDKLLFVVFPILKPLLVINFVGVFINSFYFAAANILAMTGGGANTEVAGLHIFYKAFLFLKFGPATAMAWVLALMLIAFTMYQLRILSRLEFKANTGE